MGESLQSSDGNKIENLSGTIVSEGNNPYQALIDACDGNQFKIQAVYAAHRANRNMQQKEKFLSPDFQEVIVDTILQRLENPSLEPGFRDERHCLVIWTRPPDHIIKLATHIQALLKTQAPNLWLMPPHRMHMTALEVAFSQTPSTISSLVSTLRPSLQALTSFTASHRSRLVKPMLSYDLAAVALSFVPAAGEPIVSPPPAAETDQEFETQLSTHGHGQLDDKYSYHHVRRDVFDQVKTAGIDIASRYVVPSAHITLGRFITQDATNTPEKRKDWISNIEQINSWLESSVWGQRDTPYIGEWVVGQERGLDCRSGSLWYGGGKTIALGEGF